MLFSKRLKIVLRSKTLYVLLSICTIFYVLICTKLIKYHSVFEDGIAEVTGKVINYSVNKDKLTIIIKSNEKIKVNFYIKDKMPNIEIGDILKIKGKLTTPSNNTIPNTFNYKKYLYNQKIYKVMNADSITIEKENFNIVNKIKNYIYKRSAFNEYISMFIIGDKANLDSGVYDGCKSIGVAHLLAISGMHISVFVAILSKILKRINENISHIFISIFLIFYAYIVNFSASILRVVIGYILRACCDLLDLKLNSYYILGLTAAIILWINPFFIYQISFIYSFTAVFSIIYTSKYLKGKYLSDLLIISFWTLLFSLPITINLNYEINLISLVANLLLIPYVTFCLYPLSLVSFIIPIFTFIFQILTEIMEVFVLTVSKIEIFTINIPKLGWGVIIIYYIILLLLVYFNYKRLFLLLILLIGCVKYGSKFDKSYKVNFLDVGQGDSGLIIAPYFETTILIDTGGVISFNKNNDSYLSNNLILYFKSMGIKKINYLLISHGDMDHMGEAINLVENFKVEKVIFNCGEFNELEKDLIKVLDKNKIPYYSCIKELNIDDNKLYFLNNKDYGNENDNSSVIYTELNNHKFLFMGDSGVDAEEDLIEQYNLKNIDVLKVGHHGSKTSSSKNFINEINPKYSVISVGKNNRYGHPNKEVLNTLNESKIYRTDQDGSIMFKIKNNKLKIETCRP